MSENYDKVVDNEFVNRVLSKFFESYAERKDIHGFEYWKNKKGVILQKKEWWCSLQDFNRLVNMTVEQYKEECEKR